MRPTIGADDLGNDRCSFRVWAPNAGRVDLHVLRPQERVVPLTADDGGYFHAEVDGVGPGALYLYRLDERVERPDPASRLQPEGVHGPSQVLERRFPWSDAGWDGLPLERYLIYELHVGTFTPEGTFDAIIPVLAELRDLGITAVELMPVAQFPGDRNWGYDGVQPFAVQNSYGGPQALKRLVDACHNLGLAAVLDVVYNHLGPEGNYLADFGPYFTDRYRTPWGPALNFDGPDSDPVRWFFIENALYWITEFHFDALRLDAVHAIRDHSPLTFLEELVLAVRECARELHRRVYLFAESTANDSRLVRGREAGGYGVDAQWNDDFHHALHALVTGERSGYYADYGGLGQLVKAYREGFVYSGEHSRFYRRRHGTPSRDIPAERFIVFAQNHDQVGNRRLGDRLTRLLSFEELKVVAGAVLLSPFIPLLFMGEEYGEEAPFPYFVSHSDPELVESVRRGRDAEFRSFGWSQAPPDPQAEETFLGAKLNRNLRYAGRHRVLWEFYRELIRLRRRSAALALPSKARCDVAALEAERVLVLRRWHGSEQAFAVFNFGDVEASVRLPEVCGSWIKALDSADARWLGEGSRLPPQARGGGAAELRPKSLAVFTAAL
ncbi:MAG TPA: malto-oligosyltrehalose trehalohydrolase [candidate division Zixibacteria bacterium]|nr:malto-oligosyltrehalose trehalohydrolase [candidate division Zixibacteria bacterium]